MKNKAEIPGRAVQEIAAQPWSQWACHKGISCKWTLGDVVD